MQQEVFSYFLLIQLLKLKCSLWPFVQEAEGDEEDFKDVSLEDDTDLSPQPEEESNEVSESVQGTQTIYLSKARNPLYCKAEYSCLWELVLVSVIEKPTKVSLTFFVSLVNPTLSSISTNLC